MTPVQQFIINRHAGQRLDNFLIRELKPLPRSRIMRMIRRGEVRVNGKRAKVHLKLQERDRVRVPPYDKDEGEVPTIGAWLIDMVRKNVIYEDERLLAVNKPSGVAVHAGTSITYGLIDAVRACFDREDIDLAHRLDRDTSGCVIFAKTRVALLEVHYALQHQKLIKRYEGIVSGCWPQSVTRITAPLRTYRLPNDERRAEVHSEGKAATTFFEILRTTERLTWLRIEPKTGRMHQIRAHCQHIGHPLIGDDKYAPQVHNKSKKLLLHATGVQFENGLTIECAIPSYFEDHWNTSQREEG